MITILKNTALKFAKHIVTSLGTAYQYSTLTSSVKASFSQSKLSELNYEEGKAFVIVGCATSSKVSLLEGKNFTIRVYKSNSSGTTLTTYTGLYGARIEIVLPKIEETYQIDVVADIEGVGEARMSLEMLQ